eukprot:scaffold676_cov273-Pinguiococcus_pyrenoidosus.AAC.10
MRSLRTGCHRAHGCLQGQGHRLRGSGPQCHQEHSGMGREPPARLSGPRSLHGCIDHSHAFISVLRSLFECRILGCWDWGIAALGLQGR